MEKNKRKLYIARVLLVAGAVIIVPKLISSLSDKIYEHITSNKDVDWGPEIVKKKNIEKTEEK